MNLDGPFRDAEIEGDLLVEEPVSHQDKHLALASSIAGTLWAPKNISHAAIFFHAGVSLVWRKPNRQRFSRRSRSRCHTNADLSTSQRSLGLSWGEPRATLE